MFVSDHPLLCPDLSFFVGPSPSCHRVFLSGSSSHCLHSLICVFTLNITDLSYLYSRVCIRTIIYSTSLYCLSIDHSLFSHYTMCSYPNHHLISHLYYVFTRTVQLQPLFSIFQSGQYSVPDLPLGLCVLKHRARLPGAHLLAKANIYDAFLLMWCNIKFEDVLFRSNSRHNDRVDGLWECATKQAVMIVAQWHRNQIIRGDSGYWQQKCVRWIHA